jgi:hypothetical protein
VARGGKGPRLGPSARFFFYGTLLDPDIQRRVIGRALGADALAPATLSGYRRVRAAGQWFPILVPGLAADTVDGALASGFNPDEIARLIAYEGPSYGLQRVSLRLAGGATGRGLVFLPKSGLKPSNEPWDLARWQREEKPRVLRGSI